MVFLSAGSLGAAAAAASESSKETKDYRRTDASLSLELARHHRIRSNADGTSTLNLDVMAPAYGKQVMDLTMVLDVSSGMAENGKLDYVKKAAKLALERMDRYNKQVDYDQRHRAALVKYSGNYTKAIGNTTYKEGGLTTNHTQLISKLTDKVGQLKRLVDTVRADESRPNDGPRQSHAGIDFTRLTALDSRRHAVRGLIFVSNGNPVDANANGVDFNVHHANRASEIARRIKDYRFPIYTIGLFPGASEDGDDNTNMFMQSLSSNYPMAMEPFEGSWETVDGKRVWKVTLIPEALGAGGNRHGGYYRAVSDSSQLPQIFSEICSELSRPIYKGATIVDELSEYVRPTGITYDKNVESDGYYKVTSGVTLSYSGDSAEAPVQGRDYDLWFNPNGHGTVRAKFAGDYNLKALQTYTISFNIEPTQHGYDTYAANARKRMTGRDLYDGTVGSDDSDMPGNTTSAGKPGFRCSDQAYMDYRGYSANERATFDSRPVVQVAASTLTIVQKWKDGLVRPEYLKLEIVHGDTVIPVTMTEDEQGEWKTSVVVAAGEQRSYQVRAAQASHDWDTIYRHQLGTQSEEDGDTVTFPASTTHQEATVTATNQPMAVLPKSAIPVTSAVRGKHTPHDFSYTMTAIGPNADKVYWPGGKRSSKLTLRNVSENNPVTESFCDDIKLPTPNSITERETYTFAISEDGADRAPHGWIYDDTTHKVTVTVAYDKEQGKWTATPDTQGVRFDNHYFAVAALPLTGGNAYTKMHLIGMTALAITTVAMTTVCLIYRSRMRASRARHA
ncbi:VWA domain-containing protein [Bifidobacterium sp. 64T4]|uniref:DUF7604 domain-containing protein n=1 Tax=Bifidobacterium pongonis TaxID=2834432 RepID=UPI001C5A28EA|nr:FctA domain-containing protein [Bifidobacterium pongonis]MBW3094287.1 VWA domain-containing protein [Bifidobacterium pongonis]